MKILPDTHILLWLTIKPHILSTQAKELLENPANELFVSAASIWEVSIKKSLGRDMFDVDPQALLQRLIEIGFTELPVTSRHAFGVAGMKMVHKDPFDRLLLAQATAEYMMLLTSDPQLARYPGPVQLV